MTPVTTAAIAVLRDSPDDSHRGDQSRPGTTGTSTPTSPMAIARPMRIPARRHPNLRSDDSQSSVATHSVLI